MKKTLRMTPVGTRDLLFEEAVSRRQVENRLAEVFTLRGYSEVMTPGMEFYDVFNVGEQPIPVENMYKLSDNKGRLLVMRPDSTMPIARLVASRLREVPLPIRLYYAQDVFRLNHGLSGHNDQEFQTGVELIGASQERADLEVLALAAECLKDYGKDQFRIEIGHVGFLGTVMARLDADEEQLEAIRECLESRRYAALEDLLNQLPASPEAEMLRKLPRLFGGEEVLAEARKLLPAAETAEALDYLERLYSSLCRLGLQKQILIDLGLVHTNEYYTGVIFRGYLQGSGETVVSGGRYDTLLKQYGADLPATGFGVNVDAVSRVMLGRGEVLPPAPPQILVHGEPGFEPEAVQTVNRLTRNGSICELSVFDSIEEARRYAQKRDIRELMIVSETTTVVKAKED